MIHLRFYLLLLLWPAAFTAQAQNSKIVLGDAVLTPSEIAEGATVTYLIRFQNIGLDTAIDVVVRDTLDPRLDFTTFQMVTASHEYHIVRDENSNIVRWFFDNIQLPDSSSGGAESIGFIMFSVRPKPFLAPGQVIINRACIDFDEQPTICTNDAPVWIDAGSDVDNPTEHLCRYHVVPNPNFGQFEVRAREVNNHQATNEPDAFCWITDLQGRTVWEGRHVEPSSVANLVSLERPAPGLYLLWVQSESLLQVDQFAVIR